jgi:hypothetical protein
MPKEVVNITIERYNQLQMLENTNYILEAKIEELLEEIRKLKNEKDILHR